MAGLNPMTITSLSTGASGKPIWPSDITGLYGWYMADQIQGIASGTSLSLWTDSSGSGSHTSTTATGVTCNGVFLTGVRPAGTGLALAAVSFGSSTSQGYGSNTSSFDFCTYAVVWQPTNTTAGLVVGRQNISEIDTVVSSTLSHSFKRGTGAGSVFSVTTTSTSKWMSMIAIPDVPTSVTTVTLTVDGTVPSTRTASVVTSGQTSSGGLSIGGTPGSANTMSGLVGEVMAFNRNLNESERSQLDSYMRTKWGF